jgi:hypothetical protein
MDGSPVSTITVMPPGTAFRSTRKLNESPESREKGAEKPKETPLAEPKSPLPRSNLVARRSIERPDLGEIAALVPLDPSCLFFPFAPSHLALAPAL